MLQISIIDMTNLKLQQQFPGANESIIQARHLHAKHRSSMGGFELLSSLLLARTIRRKYHFLPIVHILTPPPLSSPESRECHWCSIQFGGAMVWAILCDITLKCIKCYLQMSMTIQLYLYTSTHKMHSSNFSVFSICSTSSKYGYRKSPGKLKQP